MIGSNNDKPMRKRSKHFADITESCGGGIAVWKELLNGLSRADLKSRLVSKKAQKVGTDGNRNRYLRRIC